MFLYISFYFVSVSSIYLENGGYAFYLVEEVEKISFGIMFSSPSSAIESHHYDFEKEENAVKWKGVFVNSLRKVCIRLIGC